MDLELAGRRAVVTGGTRGIGLAIGRALAAEGADIALVGRDSGTLAREAQHLAETSERRILAIVADTGDDDSIDRMVEDVLEQFGGVDILVNAAATPSAVPGLREEDLEREVRIKVRGYLRCIRAVAPHMIEQGWGRIINIGGINARQAGSLVGSVRNVAVAAMTKNLADELGPLGINVTVLHPGWTRTEKIDEAFAGIANARGISALEAERNIASTISIGRLATMDEVAAVAAFLASPKSVALNGDAIVATGGMRGPIYY